jgi:4-amino-4-deoxy-L-arabinose transferase-like glycosyltransferase
MPSIASALLRKDRVLFALAPAIVLAFLIPGLGAPVVQREQELRVALTARHMVETGAWLDPEYLGQSRFRKPPLMYWAVAIAYRLGGRTDSAWLARLPSALAGAALALLIAGFARRDFGRRRALLAALICGTSFIALRQSRLAETDTLLTVWTALAAFAGYRSLSAGCALSWTLLAGLASGAGFLTKGPAAIAIPLLAWCFYVAASKTGRPPALRAATHLLAWFAVTLLVVAPWYIYISTRAESLPQLRAELAETFGGGTRHSGPWYYYAYTIFHALAPWSLALPFALGALMRNARARAGVRFAIAWLAAAFLALSVTSSKQIHYALLLAPPAALLVGPFLYARFRRARIPLRVIAGVGLLYLTVYLTLTLLVVPSREPKQKLAALLRAERSALRQAPAVFLVGRHRATIEFHAGRPIRDTDNIREVWRLARPGDLVILNAPEAQWLTPPGPYETVREVRGPQLDAAIWRVR